MLVILKVQNHNVIINVGLMYLCNFMVSWLNNYIIDKIIKMANTLILNFPKIYY